jgi:hypothetical protein
MEPFMNPDPISFEMLANYALNEATDAQRQLVEAQISRSPELATVFEQIQSVVATLRRDESVEPPREVVKRAVALMAEQRRAAAPHWPARIKQFIARLIFDTRQQPALAGFRGTATAYQAAYASDLISIDLQIEPEGPSRMGRPWTIRGQIRPIEGDRPEATDVLEVLLQRLSDGVEIAQTEPDLRGRFKLSAEPGDYKMIIGLASGQVVIDAVHVG